VAPAVFKTVGCTKHSGRFDSCHFRSMDNERPDIPQVERVLEDPSISIWFNRISRPIVVDLVREHLESVRSNWRAAGRCPDYGSIIVEITKTCRRQYLKRPIPVINCSGVIIHTNLGRAPISRDVWRRVEEANTGYLSLEYNIAEGKRGNRDSLIVPLFSHLVGSESAMVVNNNAAALFLILSVCAKRREVVVSRGELVQIGGGFRIPDILKQSGAKLVEVGTTNITTTDDYIQAITERTAMVLKVHRSNFAIRGFANTPTTKELSKALPESIMLVVDQGSGALDHTICGETGVAEHIESGAHIVSFSADKLLGSVQAGCIVGSKELLLRLRNSALYRVLRPGKTVLTILEQTLVDRLNGDRGVPIRMASRSCGEMMHLGNTILEDLPKGKFSLQEAPMTLGGGSTPDEYISGIAIRIESDLSPTHISAKLRQMVPPVVGQIVDKCVLLHLGTIQPHQIDTLKTNLKQLLQEL